MSENDPSQKLTQLVTSHGDLRRGTGLLSGVVALTLAVCSLLGVIAFHFPAYLSTPEMRHVYDVTTLRYIMLGAMVVAGGVSLGNIILGRSRWLAAVAFTVLVVAQVLGGPTTPIPDFPDHTPYLGLDFLILDLLGSTLIFVVLEKLMPLRVDQPVFRAEWQTDLAHFIFNHLIVGFVLFVVNHTVHASLGWAVNGNLQSLVNGLPFVIQLLLVVLVADLFQYWTHRAYHEVPFLWRIHSVHHSAKSMDWIAGSRQHVAELLITRMFVLAPIFFLGFSERVINSYVVIVGFQAVFNHCNVSVRLGPLRYVIVTPNFHHWHHSRDTEAVDKNYAAHFAFLDYAFGTAVTADRMWPRRYGVIGDYVPPSFVAQLLFPFIGSTEDREKSSALASSEAWTPPPKEVPRE